MRLDADQKQKVLELTELQGTATEYGACGSEPFAVSDTAEPTGVELDGYTTTVICGECRTPVRAFEAQESDLRARVRAYLAIGPGRGTR